MGHILYIARALHCKLRSERSELCYVPITAQQFNNHCDSFILPVQIFADIGTELLFQTGSSHLPNLQVFCMPLIPLEPGGEKNKEKS